MRRPTFLALLFVCSLLRGATATPTAAVRLDSFPEQAASQPPFEANALPRSAFFLTVGSDLERTPRKFQNYTPAITYLQAALGYRHHIGAHLFGQAEVSFQQWATPRITYVSTQRSFLDKERITILDSFSVMRMKGVALSLSGGLELPLGLSVQAGAQLGFFSETMSEQRSIATSDISPARSGRIGWDYGYNSAPQWFRTTQTALRLGVEKRFFRNWLLGLQLVQGLTDLSREGEGAAANRSTNWMAYAGYAYRW